jgi:hypothetical protein
MAIPALSKGYITDTGHIDPWWTNEHRNLNYCREPFNSTTDTERWRKMGFTHDNFTGEMYDMKNPEPHWMQLDQFRKVFNFENLSWSFYRMTPGDILPEHVDTFARFKKVYNTSNYVIVRALVMMEDWQPGHYLDLDGKPIVGWKAGDWSLWSETAPHTAANIGSVDRYTLQLTGMVKL